jgi:hypothetical protein
MGPLTQHAWALSPNGRVSSWISIHYTPRIHYGREYVDRGLDKVLWIPTEKQLSDIQTDAAMLQ